MALKKGDFIEVEYTGKLDNGEVFDTTDEKTARENNIPTEGMKFGPVIVAIGESHLLPGLDSRLEGKELGEYSFHIPDIEAFGKKKAALLKTVPIRHFKGQEMPPMPGMEIEVEGERGIIKHVGGGRVMVDFNHPLASKDVFYNIKINRIVTDTKERVEGLLSLLHVPFNSVAVSEKDIVVKSSINIPDIFRTQLIEDIVRLTGIRTVELRKEEEQKPEPGKEKEGKKRLETEEDDSL